MPAKRSIQSATTRASKPPRVIHRMIAKLLRVRQFGGADHGQTLMFRFEGGTSRNTRSTSSFINPDRVRDFDGEEAWFEVEQVSATPWSYWRAVRQVEPPADA